MRYIDYLESCLDQTVQALGLPRLARGTFQLLARLDLDSAFAERVQEEDPHHRSGVLSWSGLAADYIERGGDVFELEQAVMGMERWGLVQVVGRNPKDPVVPGSSALRLTHAARSCLGLGPGRTNLDPAEGDLDVWNIQHSASRERLLLHTRATHPEVFDRMLVVRDDMEADVLCGRIAMGVCQNGGILLDAFDITGRGGRLLEQVLRRTADAVGHRVLMVPDPSLVRVGALASRARLEWVEPAIETRREKAVLDSGVSDQLMLQHEMGKGDLLGVPDSQIATPRRVETAWEDLVVPKKVQWELRQVLLHARYRLGETSDRFGRKKGYRLLLSGLPGTGKSMCAEALATTLDRPLVKLDLSSVLSKWLGETEKLLAQVFDVAEAANAVLVLDEAESLLRQRGGDGKGGGMGALSTGVAYLLTRLDSYTGVLVATTNRTRDLDEAFFRRFDDFVILPIPDRPTRVRLWSTFLGDGAGDLDLEFIGGHFAISGGLIRSAAIRADAWRVGMELPMETPLVLASLARELEKNDRSSVEAMVEPYRKAVMELLDGPLEDER
jgi:hypothetical protein